MRLANDFADYCDIFLTHDTLAVRKDHNSGWKHRMNVQNYYANLPKDKIRLVIEKVSLSYDTRPEIKKDKPQFVPVSDDPNALYGVAKWATLSDNPDGGKRWQRYNRGSGGGRGRGGPGYSQNRPVNPFPAPPPGAFMSPEASRGFGQRTFNR